MKRSRAFSAAHQSDPASAVSAWSGRDSVRAYLLFLLTGLLLAGCASIPKDYPRTKSSALKDDKGTAIGRYVAKAAARHPGESGFAIIRYGRQAFTDRVALSQLAEKTLDLQYYIWEPDATGRIVWDDPREIAAAGGTSGMLEGLHRRARTLEADLLIESPYFVPRDRGIGRMAELHDQGVRIRVLTNSLASNDVLAAHAGYAGGRRKQVLESGVELYELRADAGAIRKRVAFFGSKAALHAKVVVFDRKDVFVGSFNLDPRSADINTEAGLYVESPELAAQVIAWMDEGVRPENSYRVLLDEDGKLIWVTQDKGKKVVHHQDPESTAWQRFVTGFIRILPVEDQL